MHDTHNLKELLKPTTPMIEAACLYGPDNLSPGMIEAMLEKVLTADPLFINRIKAKTLRDALSQMRDDELDRNITDEDYCWSMGDVSEWITEQAHSLENNPNAGASPWMK
jgi:hypothetical protein